MVNFGDDKIFIENYEKLKSSRKMAELYNCDKSSILNHAKKIGYSNNKHIKIKNRPVEEIYDKYLELGTITKVAEYYGCSSTAINNYLKENNYSLNNYYKLNNISDEEFIMKYNELKSAKEMSKFYNCSDTAILQHAHKIGYNPNMNKNYKLTQVDKEYIINNYFTKSSSELATQFNVSRGMITKIWYDNNLQGKIPLEQKTNAIDLTDLTFGSWKVLSKAEERTSSGGLYWYCECTKCGTKKNVSSLSLQNGSSLSCGCVHISKGEEKIANLLSENNIFYERQKKFVDCKDINYLPFDFYVENKYLIEYDGEQHYQSKKECNWMTEEKLAYTKYHDSLKSKWCKKNKILLIRIPYTQYKNLSIKDLLLETSNFIEK